MRSSKNEVTIAIFLGILVGLVSMLFFYFLTRKTNLFKNRVPSISVKINTTTSPQKTPSQLKEEFDLILNPLENEIISEVPDFKISGKTSKNAGLILLSGEDAINFSADKLGNFEKTIQLKEGLNQIFITAFSANQEITLEKTIYYDKKI